MILGLLALLGCTPPGKITLPKEDPAAAIAPGRTDASRVFVVINRSSAESLEIGEYYIQKRGIPEANVVKVDCMSTDTISNEDFEAKLRNPIRRAIDKCPNHIDFLVTTKGVPLRIGDDGGHSVDAHLAGLRLKFRPIERPEPEQIQRAVNPYFNQREPFDSKKYGFYLATRLDGYTVAAVRKLVDNSLAAKASQGPFLFDQAANRTEGGYADLQSALKKAADGLKKAGYTVVLDSGPQFAAPKTPLAGYAGWGSNDANFSLEAYRSLTFQPGALAETFVSTSGRTFRPVEGGQSLIGDLIAQGVTGVKGYVSEPFTFALARPEVLFDRYTSGYNLAESFSMASPILKWKDVVIGDPLCAPYAKP